MLNQISTEIYEGDFTIIMGPSGAGKSTLLYALSGMDTLNSGKVLYQNQELGTLSEKKIAALQAKEFGFVFQQTHLVSNLTLFENVAVAGYLEKGKSGENSQGTGRILCFPRCMWRKRKTAAFPDFRRRGPAGGHCQSYDQPAGLLFADEPTGALNRKNSEEVMDLLASLNQEGQSILMVTHDVKAAIRGTRILYLEDGKILDEMPLPSFDVKTAKEREEKVSGWLASLSW